MHRTSFFVAALAAWAGLPLFSAAIAEPPGTSFSYQGFLEQNGTPVTTAVDVRFTLYSDASGTMQVESPLTVGSITPDNGVFSTSLDFGVAAYTANEALWMRIEVSDAGMAMFDDLGLQKLEATPFALNTRGINVDASGKVGLGTDAPAYPVSLATGSGNYGFSHHLTDESSDITTYVDVSGGWIGTVASVPLFFYTGDSLPHMTIDTAGSIGIGTQSPQADFHVASSGVDNDSTGILVENLSPGNTFGVDAVVAGGTGVQGTATALSGTTFGVVGRTFSPNGFGVFSVGRIAATGTKSFCIDHPLNPEEQMLLHYSSEAPEPQNRYNGNVVLNANGTGVVRLPSYFESINTDFRYNLTPIGGPAPDLHIAREIASNQFMIRGGQAGQKISWEVTARRNDAFVRMRGAPIEIQKNPEDRGRYLMPEAYGAPASQGIHARDGANDR